MLNILFLVYPWQLQSRNYYELLFATFALFQYILNNYCETFVNLSTLYALCFIDGDLQEVIFT